MLSKPYQKYTDLCNHLANIVLLISRVWIAKVFFLSGLTKVNSWEQTLFLFEYEYAVPLLPVGFAAFLSTFAELVFPVFLLFGLLSRVAVLPLLIMTLVIELFIVQNNQHLYWILIQAVIMSYGSGKLSIDNFLERKFDIKL